MTTTEREPKVPVEKLNEWRESRAAYMNLAAKMTEWAAGKERGTALPDNSFFAANLYVQVGATTFRDAKRLLEREGVLYRNDGPYMVALQAPA